MGRNAARQQTVLERFELAPDAAAFWQLAAHPRTAAQKYGEQFIAYLERVLRHNAPLQTPQDVAALLASYARDAAARLALQPDMAALTSIRAALEEALGLKFTGAKGEHFFRSTLVQTLFYGIFSAWVLWHREQPQRKDQFNWPMASDYLRVPVLHRLFYLISDRTQLNDLDLFEVLEWAGAALGRVDRPAFFAAFATGHEIQYFYEPFLEAFDPALRKELGVWYTPSEIVQYQVARVDAILRNELKIEDGLAASNVYVLDPCCGTGAYLVEVLKKIAADLKEKHGPALYGAEVKKAATERVFGFEILPAPFVVAHLQLGLLLQNFGARLTDKKTDRIGVFLTNALTGWEPPKQPKQKLLFQEFEEERDAANEVKQAKPILVILGNPPYNGFAGVAVEEERDLSNAYRSVKKVAAPQGQGLNDLLVRFFRMAERRIVEMNKPAQGVISFISNYAWLDGLSFTGMRERYLEAFDSITIDCLNGDKYKTGKLTPDGQSDPSVFSTDFNREGIQLGTAIATLVKAGPAGPPGKRIQPKVHFRHFWGKTKRADLLAAHDDNFQSITPALEMGLSFMPATSQTAYFSWPQLTELFTSSFPGVKTSRDPFLVDVDRERLENRVRNYFDPKISHDEIRRSWPDVMEVTSIYDAENVRDILRKRGLKEKRLADGSRKQISIRYCYRPFDMRWLYWEPDTNLVDRKREDYLPHVFEGNIWLSAVQQNRKDFDPPIFAKAMCSLHVIERGANMFPLWLRDPLHKDNAPNLGHLAASYLKQTGATPEDLFFHTLAILHAPNYRAENAGALRQDWPRIPLPKDKGALLASAALGRKIAALLDVEQPVPGITIGQLRPELKGIAEFALPAGKSLDEANDFAITAGWGHAGKEGVTMPGRGKLVTNGAAVDVYLNDSACWRNVPVAVWEYTIGGYQVIKKWLSYREQPLLGRSLKLEEVQYVTEMARRIAALLALQDQLDANYRACKNHA